MDEFVAKPCTTDLYYLGECCRWDDVREELYWIDVATGRFFRARADGTRVSILRTYDVGGQITAVAPLEPRSDGWIVASDQSISLLDEAGAMHEVASPEAHNAPEVRMNDGAADPWGRFWIGSMALDEAPGRGSLYRYHASTGAELVFDGVTVSNGLGWSPDRGTMYYVDSGPGTIHSFDVDEDGEISNKKLFVNFDVESEGAPDGLCVDVNGAVWVALWGGYEVRAYTPSGEQFARVKVTTAQPSCCAIGGANGTTLYITTAQEDLDPATLAAEPDAGRLFCADVHVAGLPLETYRPSSEGSWQDDLAQFPPTDWT
jgi:sugar lactone lactonase YvrE